MPTGLDPHGRIYTTSRDVTRACGRGRNECVVLWLSPTERRHSIARIAHPDHTATPLHYRLDDQWLTVFLLGLAKSGERVAAQVHTHRGRAGHSKTDDEGAFAYEAGFLSIVVPRFAMDDDTTKDVFLAEVDEAGLWREQTPAARLSCT